MVKFTGKKINLEASFEEPVAKTPHAHLNGEYDRKGFKLVVRTDDWLGENGVSRLLGLGAARSPAYCQA